MSKRKAETQKGIKAAFAKAQEVSKASTRKFPPLEAADTSSPVPDAYSAAVVEKYIKYRDDGQKLASSLALAAKQRHEARTHINAAATAAELEQDNAASIDELEAAADAAASRENLIQKANAWQKNADDVVRPLSMWAGTQVPLQQQLQECLLHITLNYDLHPNPVVSTKAYQLLQQNVAAHPPAKAAKLQEGEPCILQRNDLLWHPLRKPEMDKADDADDRPGKEAKEASKPPSFREILGGSNFELLSKLIRNAVHLLTGNPNSSCYSARPSGNVQPSYGKGLVLLYLVQLLEADALVRLAVFEQHMQYAKGLGGEDVQKVHRRAANVLKDSLLHRLLQSGGLGWDKLSDADCSKHRLMRDLLVMVATKVDDCPAGSSSSIAVAGAASAGQPTAAAGSSGAAEPLSPADVAATAAAEVQPLQPSELVGAARRLLLLLLQLYSGLEAAGEYGGGAGAHHAARGTTGQNDRWWLDYTMLLALSSIQALPVLRTDVAGSAQAAAAALQRVLQLLPPVHRVRLVAMGVAEAISNRPYDDKGAKPNNHIDALHAYYANNGKGNAAFRRGDGLEVMKALRERKSWASKEVLGGKEAFAIVIASFISAAVAGKQVPGAELSEFKEAAQEVLSEVVRNSNLQLASCAAQQGSEVLFSVQLALRQLEV